MNPNDNSPLAGPTASALSPNFTGKVVLVTGGSRGIGRAIVESMASLGGTVVFTYVSQHAEAKELESELQSRNFKVSAVQADVRKDELIAPLFESLEKDHGRLDVLVNNAGVTRDALIAGMDDSNWNDVLATNLTGPFNCSRRAARLMMRRRQGAIINISSLVAQRPGRGHCNYAASKGGLEAMTKALAAELAPRNIRVNCVAPGMIVTDMSQELRELAGDQVLARIPLKRYGEPSEIAASVCFLASEVASYITGTTLHVDGGMII